MEWLIRFWIGLPARPQDIKSIRKDFPEILDGDWQVDEKIGEIVWRMDRYAYRIGSISLHEFRRWIREIEYRETEEKDEYQLISADSCPASDCPIKKLTKPSTETNDEPLKLRFTYTVGGPNQKAPKDEFFQLVRKVHRGTRIIREVILTDPYIYSDVDEHGNPGGINNLAEYLRILNLNPASAFILKTNPNPKRYSEKSEEIFQRTLNKIFPRIKFQKFSG
jgi:hypothetical protein